MNLFLLAILIKTSINRDRTVLGQNLVFSVLKQVLVKPERNQEKPDSFPGLISDLNQLPADSDQKKLKIKTRFDPTRQNFQSTL